MLHRAPIEVLVSIVLVTSAAIAQHDQASDTSQPANPSLGVKGTVLNSDGKPASGIHVELDEPSTAMPITSTYTEPDGTFALYNIPDGNYELVAESIDSLANPVIVSTGESHLKLRLQHSALPMEQLPPTVSVSQMIVPE